VRVSGPVAPARFGFGIVLPALLWVLTGGVSAHARLAVVATTADLAALAREIGDAQVEVTTLARPMEDPHFVDPKPSFIVKLNRADVLLHGGAELESGWLPALLNRTPNAKIAAGGPGNLPCNTGVEMLEVPAALDRSQGDLHAAGNPHYLVDPVNARIVAQTVAGLFARLDPAHADLYEANREKFMGELDAKLAAWQRQLAPFHGARIAAYHNSWPYFARRFGLRMDLFLEPKPGIPPSPAHLAAVIKTMKEQQVKIIFRDPYVHRRTAEAVANATGAVVVDVTQYPGGVNGTEAGYVAMMDYLVRAAAGALAGRAN